MRVARVTAGLVGSNVSGQPIYRRVFDSRHLRTDCQEEGSATEPYARQLSMGYLDLFTSTPLRRYDKSQINPHCSISWPQAVHTDGACEYTTREHGL